MSGTPIAERVTAAAEGEVVVFLIGMRVNRWRSVRHWLPVMAGMPRMVRELRREPGSGLLAYRMLSAGPREYMVVQYWESREKLLAYARGRGRLHRPAWTAFNRRARAGAGRVGVWHETYVVPAGSHESLYSGMPAYGLGAAHGVRSARCPQAPDGLNSPSGA